MADTTRAHAPKEVIWVNVLFFGITFFLGAVVAPLYLWFHGISWGIVAATVLFVAATCMSITGGYHRLFAHRSYKAKPILRFFYLLVGTAAFEGSLLQWVSDHRRHHRFADTDLDPHNINEGFFWAHMGWLCLRERNGHVGPRMETMPDLTKDPLILFQHRNYIVLASVLNFIAAVSVGWFFGDILGGILVAGFARIVFTNHFTFLINSLAHTHGKRPYNDKQTARDSWLMAFLAYGEGFHNFHHQFASDYRNGSRWYHWDPTKWLIKTLSFIGWSYDLKTVGSNEILKARLKTEGTALLATGACADTVARLKQRVEEAQARWRQIREEYVRVKTTMANQSRERLVAFRADLKVAKREFKYAWAQWGAYYRSAGRAVPAM